MILNGTQSIFKKSCLASLIGLFCMPSAYALQQLSDDSLSETTGEGVALILDNFKMVFQGVNNASPVNDADLSTSSSYTRGLTDPGKYDTGFIRIIPTGENYTQLGQRAYQKIYDLAYTNSMLAQQASSGYTTIYQTTFDSIYTPEYNRLAADYTRNIRSNEESKAPQLRQEQITAYRNSDLMKAYYKQRYDDYYDGAGRKPGIDWYTLDDDGTTPHSLYGGNIDGSKEAAEKNTLEMIELLYGNKNTVTLPNAKFFRDKGIVLTDRKNVIDASINTYIENQIALKTQEAKNMASVQASALARPPAQKAKDDLYKDLVLEANRIASEAAANPNIGKLKTKADVFVYGLALSKSDDSLNTRYSNEGFNWGSEANPWLFRAGTQKLVEQPKPGFKDTDPEQQKFEKNDIGYLALEAPLAQALPDLVYEGGKIKFDAASERKLDQDNNIKLGFWTDIFARELDSLNDVDPATGAPVSGLNTEDRLRTQFVANGLSLNGSQIRLFQTGKSDHPDHNETLGMAALIRINTDNEPHRLNADQGNELNRRGIRISTAGTTLEDTTVATPAQRLGATAPVFNAVEGLYLYSPNINLVLGNMYQPFVFGSDENNIVLEITRIPNIKTIYQKIYQDYGFDHANPELSTQGFLGSTCNYYQCGQEITANNTTYQGRNATHSSISIGSVERLPGNILEARKDDNSTGIMFKNIAGNATNLGSVVIDGVLIQHLKIRTTGL